MIKCKLQPLHGNIVVRRDESASKSGNIFLPHQAKKKAMTGTVMAVGGGYETASGVHVSLKLKVGQRVLLPSWSGGNDIRDDRDLGEGWCVIHEKDVLAVIE
jgi:co-chaperonin GroES (HSP10)